MARIDPLFYPLAALDIPFLGGESLQFGFQTQQHGLRKAVRQMQGRVLRGVEGMGTGTCEEIGAVDGVALCRLRA